ncbi:MAG: FtsX-like permease family protein [Spirochaetes bacterium]|nr:FtsX-like permease family protein [Spirochaetota bacterium]
MIVTQIAYGNLFLHRSKTIILGVIMSLGIAVLFLGNSLIDTAVNGLHNLFVNGYTGDLMVTGPTSFPTTIFGETAGGENVVPHIAKLDSYTAYLEKNKDVAAAMPMLSGQAAIGLGENVIGRGSAFGVNIKSYRNFFSNNLTLVEGDWPSESDSGWLMISQQSEAVLSRAARKQIMPGDKVVLSAIGDSAGTVIREVTVKGIVKFNQSNQQLSNISLVDADTLRDLLGFASLRDGVVKLDAKDQQFVENFNPDALFGDSSQGAAQAGETATTVPAAFADNAAADNAAASPAAVPPAWQYLLIKIKPGANAKSVQKDLTSYVASLDQSDHVQDWIAGAGTVARTAVTIRLVFDLLVSIVAIVVIMITMNVLVISISERVPEIGTLRALGARKSFIRQMILLETSFLAIFAGLIGLVVGFIILFILGKTGIKAPNLFFEGLFGGPKLMPQISLGAALKAFAWIFGMSIISSLYPIMLALRIKPVVAMQGE